MMMWWWRLSISRWWYIHRRRRSSITRRRRGLSTISGRRHIHRRWRCSILRLLLRLCHRTGRGSASWWRRNKSWPNPRSFSGVFVFVVGNPCRFVEIFYPAIRQRRDSWIIFASGSYIGLLCRGEAHRTLSPVFHILYSNKVRCGGKKKC